MKKKWHLTLTILILLGVVSILIYFYFRKEAIPLKTMEVKRGGLVVTVSATTTSIIKSEQEVILSAQRSGKVTQMKLEEGDEVSKGEIVVEIDREEAKARLMEAEANLHAARARLGQTEAGVSMERIQTESQVNQTKATLDNAFREWERQKVLFQRGVAAKSSLDRAEEAYLVAKAQHERALGNLDLNKVKERDVAAAKAIVQQMEAASRLAQIQLGYSEIVAPFNGVVSKKWISQGEFVSIGSPIVTLVEPKRLYIKSTIDEVDVKNLKVGQKVKIQLDAYPDKVFPGVLKRISPIVLGAKQETRTFETWTYFEGEMPFIKPGMSADIEVITDHLQNVLSVPSTALIEKSGKKMVYLIKEGRAKLREVEVGLSNWNYTEVRRGLEEGDLIVENADAKGLKEGVRVKTERAS